MNDEFISDAEVEAYERKNDPARRSVVWSVAAVAAAFVFIGGAYALGYFGGSDGAFTASLGETFPLWSAGREEGASFAQNSGGSAVASGGVCGYENGSAPKGGAVLISEVAWMGTEEGAQYEWIELANVNGTNVEIGGWSVVDKNEQVQFVFPKSANISAGSYLLLARSADLVGSVRADYRYTGNLKNEDEGLRLFNASCNVIDEAIAAPRWPAGEVGERLTMERNLTTKTWHTSSKTGGTSKAENSAGSVASVTPSFAAVSSTVTSETTSTVMEAPVTPPVAQGVVMISEVMAGKDGATNWDFVELYNTGSGAVNLTGWSVKKKSSSGSESALVASSRLEGKTIPAGGYILLAHPDYAGTVDVVWPKSYTLAYANNAVVLYNADGVKVDEISWTEIPKGQSYAEVNATWVFAAPTPRMAP